MLIFKVRWRAISAAVVLLVTTLCNAQSQTTTAISSTNELADTAFIGYYVQPTTVERLTAAPGRSWVTSANYAGDCYGTSSCSFAVGCASNTLTFDNGNRQDCGTAASCIAWTIFQTSPYGLPSAMNYVCRAGWSAYTVYRINPVTVTASPTSTSTISTHTTSLLSITPVPSNTAAIQSETAVPTATGTANTASESKAWIAGAVIGPLVGIALIGLAVWLLIRRRKKQEPVATSFEEGPQTANYLQYDSSVFSELESARKYRPQEMSAYRNPAELSS